MRYSTTVALGRMAHLHWIMWQRDPKVAARADAIAREWFMRCAF